jgi:hypothetical protein
MQRRWKILHGGPVSPVTASIVVKRRPGHLIFLLSMLFLAQRAPAPIQEEATPTPAPERSAKPKRQSTTNQRTQGFISGPTPARAKKFAGTWSGIMPEVPWGDIQTTLVIDATETTMLWEDTLAKHGPAVRTQLNGETIVAHFPGWPKPVWYITPNPDGQTANIRLTAFMNDDHAVFRRVSR